MTKVEGEVTRHHERLRTVDVHGAAALEARVRFAVVALHLQTAASARGDTAGGVQRDGGLGCTRRGYRGGRRNDSLGDGGAAFATTAVVMVVVVATVVVVVVVADVVLLLVVVFVVTATGRSTDATTAGGAAAAAAAVVATAAAAAAAAAASRGGDAGIAFAPVARVDEASRQTELFEHATRAVMRRAAPLALVARTLRARLLAHTAHGGSGRLGAVAIVVIVVVAIVVIVVVAAAVVVVIAGAGAGAAAAAAAAAAAGAAEATLLHRRQGSSWGRRGSTHIPRAPHPRNAIGRSADKSKLLADEQANVVECHDHRARQQLANDVVLVDSTSSHCRRGEMSSKPTITKPLHDLAQTRLGVRMLLHLADVVVRFDLRACAQEGTGLPQPSD